MNRSTTEPISQPRPGQSPRKRLAQAAVLTVAGSGATLPLHAQAFALANEAVSPQPLLSFGPEQSETPSQVPAAESRETRVYDIGPGDLIQALDTYSRLTGTHIHSVLPADQLAGFHTEGARGVFTEAQALHSLLRETGLEATFSDPGHVQLAIRHREHVEVNAATAQPSLQQLPGPLVDTAQTVQVVPQYIIGEQADTNLRDTLRNVPGISIAAGEGGAQGDSLTIRGFNARNDIYLDGIRDFGSYYRDSFDFDSVDVLEGPASVEFGRGSTGGVVNQESKVPSLQPFIAGTFQFGTDEMRRGTLDVDRPIAAVPGGTAFRLNAAAEESGFAGRDVVLTRRFGVAPALAFGLNTTTRFNLAYLHEGEDSIPDYGLPYFGDGVAPVPGNTFYGLANGGNYLRTAPDVLTAKLDHDFGLHLTVRNTFRWGNYPRDFRITEPQINSAAAVLYTNPDGRNVYEGAGTQISVQCAITATPSTACFPSNTPLSQVLVKRNEIAGHSVEDILWDQLSATGRFTVGHVANNAVVLVEGGRERSNPNRPTYNLPYVPALNPNPSDSFAPLNTYPGVTTHVASQSFGVDFLDTLELTHWLQLSGGVRFDYFSTTSYAPANP
ncbi:MAG TPA: TonB-dependent receptor plug domain-containing protein, partial [Acidobacteriaceae bacterium]|nr:TonB-dependent receptor plug domain-containing protein [Acidobacteriaceae bacterium]